MCITLLGKEKPLKAHLANFCVGIGRIILFGIYAFYQSPLQWLTMKTLKGLAPRLSKSEGDSQNTDCNCCGDRMKIIYFLYQPNVKRAIK